MALTDIAGIVGPSLHALTKPSIFGTLWALLILNIRSYVMSGSVE